MRPRLLLLAIVLTGCSLIGLEHRDPAPVVPLGEPEGILMVDLRAPADGAAVSVEESIRLHLGDEAVAVRGALFIDDTYGTVWLCDSVITPQPASRPACGRPALLLRHPDPGGMQVRDVIAELIAAGQIGQLQQDDQARWSEDATYLGRILDPLAESS